MRGVQGAGRRGITLALLAVCLLAGCAVQRLRPAPEAQLAPESPNAALAEAAGIRIIVEPDAWVGRPRNLESEITPLRVTIENDSDQPLRIRYNEFALHTDTGAHYPALPPLDIRGTVLEQSDRPVYVPRFAHYRFYVAPYCDPFYVGLRPWGYPWPVDSFYYSRYYPTWRVELPTRDMRELAIPEGVVEPQGRVSGFLYFPRIDDKDARRVTFTAELMNGKDGNGIGRISIPFVFE